MLLVIFYLQFKLFRFKLIKYDTNQKDKINFSLIIAAKNEEKNISGLLEAFVRIDYPADRFEIIIVDDNSSDTTFEIATSFKSRLQNLKVIKNINPAFPRKKGALHTGITQSTNIYIAITDADCIPSPGWLKELEQQFQAGAEFVIGVSPLLKSRGLTASIAAYENFKSYCLSLSLASAGLPYSGIARNFAFKKECYFTLGGFSGTLETIGGDDDLLIREAVKQKMKISVMTGEESLVYTHPPLNFNTYMNQKARHTATSNFYLLQHKIFLAVWHCCNIFAQYSYVYFFLHPLLPLMYPMKLIFDFATGYLLQKKMGYSFSFLQHLLLPFSYEWLLMHHFFNAKSRNISWK